MECHHRPHRSGHALRRSGRDDGGRRYGLLGVQNVAVLGLHSVSADRLVAVCLPLNSVIWGAKEIALPISAKDQKLLWGKAAARCSMPECRRSLVAASSELAASTGILIGENCHIVAEKSGGPRGQSVLTTAQRNRYQNLILLCSPHHTIIDQDSKAWPINRLHQIKSEHELWVDTHLANASETLADELYSSLVNLATDSLGLSHWDGVSDHAVRSIVPVWFVDGVASFSEQVFKTIWPGEKLTLEDSIRNLASRSDAFIKHFMTRAYLKQSGFYAEDLRWKRETLHFKYRDKLYAESGRWQGMSTNLLANIVVALNEFGDVVRKQLNPHYFHLEGKFTLHDSLGITNDMRDIHYMPYQYIEITT